jgi:mono/diheme cytochrome c family protein
MHMYGWTDRCRPLRVMLSLALLLAGPVSAQDIARGAQLFTNTPGATGRAVGNCIACHADLDALREMIRNRGGRADDARSVRNLIDRSIAGAQPGAANAKAQYRGVLTPQDVRDLGAYLAQAARG